MPLPGVLESQNALIEQPPNEISHPDRETVQNHELLHVISSSPEQTDETAPRDTKASRNPAIEALALLEQPPPAHKTPGHTAGLRDQFRALVKQLTNVLTPRPAPRKRRREEMGGVFRKAAFGILRGIARIPPLHFLDPTWEAFTWLHLWEYNSGSSTDFHQSHSASFPPQNPSIRL
jgi:hypothetical protein